MGKEPSLLNFQLRGEPHLRTGLPDCRHCADLFTAWGDYSVPPSSRLYGTRFVCDALKKSGAPSVLRGIPLGLLILATCLLRLFFFPRKYKGMVGCFLNLRLLHLGMGLLTSALSGFPTLLGVYLL